MRKLKFRKGAALLVALVLAAGASASANAAVFIGSSGNLSASATFGVDGSGHLTIHLVNTSLADVTDSAQLLTAILFNVAGNPTLIPISALLNGATVFYPTADGATAPTAGNVGGEWAYARGVNVLAHGAHQGVSSSGFGKFSVGNFGGPDLSSPASVGGFNYGITSAGDNPLTGNQPLLGSGNTARPYVKNWTDFVLSGLSSTFNLNRDITGVIFQYGTTFTNPNFIGTPVPEPTTMIAGALLLLPFGASVLRILRNRKA